MAEMVAFRGFTKYAGGPSFKGDGLFAKTTRPGLGLPQQMHSPAPLSARSNGTVRIVTESSSLIFFSQASPSH